MREGTALTDEDRWSWLHAVGHAPAASDSSIVMACSAPARRYRDVIRQHAADVEFIFLGGPHDVLHDRLIGRRGHFMHASMLASQLHMLEPLAADEAGLRIDLRQPPHRIVAQAATHLARKEHR